MTKTINILLAGLMLGGCATTKPEMTSTTYSEAARMHVAVEYCVRIGWISPDIGASGKRAIENTISQYCIIPMITNDLTARVEKFMLR